MNFIFDLQRFDGTSYADLSAETQKLLDRFRDFRIAFENINEERYVRKGSSSILSPEEKTKIATMSAAITGLTDDIALVSGNLNSEITQRATQYTALSADLNSEVTLRAAQFSALSTAINQIDGGITGDLGALSIAVADLDADLDDLNLALNDETTLRAAQIFSLSSIIAALQDDIADLDEIVDGKVDKVTGKQLSTNDFTTAEKTKLAGLTDYTFGEGFSISGATVNCTVHGAAVLDTIESDVDGAMWLIV